MAKFTVYFKDKIVQSKIFDSGVIHIGRDDSNDIVIDNLAVAAAHAVVIIKDGTCVIKQLNDDFPLFINNNQTKSAQIKQNDKISIGKHSIVFSSTESILEPHDSSTSEQDIKNLNTQLEDKIKIPDANLQILQGQHIGRILPLKKAMTRFSHNGTGSIIISRRKEGYFISMLEGDAKITINGKDLLDKFIHLKQNDIILIDNISMQFFLEKPL